MSEHTSGPWKASPRDASSTGKPVGGWTVMQEHDPHRPQVVAVAYLQSHPMLDYETSEANARLVAAAPDMFAVLKELAKRFVVVRGIWRVATTVRSDEAH